MKHRAGEPWMPSDQYGRSLQGLGVNLLVADVARSIEFQREVLEVDVVYSDPDFAVCAGFGAQWMLHADHTYDRHPMGSAAATGQPRGLGVELRLHGCDPDESEAAARRLGYTVLSPAADTGHGLREAFILDPDGYTWVPDVPL
jgi:catechol 2,3-dioxygenase-like lactoylglutathione lyase family enzyme